MKDGKLADKVVIITGGNSGIGRASSILFAHEGARVVIGARNEASGESVVREIKKDGRGEALFVKTDVSQPGDIENLVQTAISHYGRLDVLYGNSGVMEVGTASETSLETWRRIIDVNLSGNFYLVKYGIPELVKYGGKSIVLTASELGTVGAKGLVAYCAAKGGIVNMVRALAIDCGPLGIRVNCLAPGPVDTPMLRDWFKDAEDPKALEEVQTKPILLGRFGKPEEIAEVGLFLASEASSFLTGSLVVADGGCTSWYGL
jgi:meso-butanediol dehydrogenase/(S,S)-butanediol dehydrogenase/diacetyl reductase